MSSKKSKVHPKFKTKYRVTDWPEYDRALVQRGDLTLWLSPDAIKKWNAKASGRRGGQQKYSNLAIETTIALRLILHLPLRQAEGFVRSIFQMMDLHLDVPDHTTLSRRSRRLRISLQLPDRSGPIDLAIDSSGLAIFGDGEWTAVKHGSKGTQGWMKLHLGVDGEGMIVAQDLTASNFDDGTTGRKIIKKTKDEIGTVIADAAYDTGPFDEAAKERGAADVVPPRESAAVGGQECQARDKSIARFQCVGRRQWKKEFGYHRQGRVENAFFRYKTIIGDRLLARDPKARRAEAVIACNILNRFTSLGRPNSVAVIA